MPAPTLMATRIREYRHLAGLSQSALSKRCGIARSAIAAAECGSKTGFGVGSLVKIADALGVSIDALVREDAPRQ